MTIIRIFVLFLITTNLYLVGYGQNTEFKNYSYNNQYSPIRFSFDIPNSWEISDEYDGTGYLSNCKDDSSEDESGCYEGLIFRVKYISKNLDSALRSQGMHKKEDGLYLTTYDGKIKIEVATKIEGQSYKGLYYTINNEIKCKGDDHKVILGHYQFIYFSRDDYTICIVTTGISFEEIVFNRLISSFRFN
jgi:hypothetical protein